MAKQLEYNATLVGREDLEPTLAVFRIRPDEITRPAGSTSGPWFTPGQYVTIGLNREVVDGVDDPRPVSVRRPMSIASAPEDEEEVELYIRYVTHPESDLPLTHVMWPIKVGDRMFCRAVATGHFTIKDTIGEDDERIKLMVAAGTGLAPFISIARSRLRRDPHARLDDLAIIHAASYATGLGYRAELEEMAEKNGLKYLPTVSRPKEVPGWKGFAGRAEALVEAGLIDETEKALGLGPGELRPDRVAVLICGLNGTIANTIIALLGRGFIPENRKIRRGLELEDTAPSSIFWEQYDNTPVIDIKDEALMKDLRARLRAAL